MNEVQCTSLHVVYITCSPGLDYTDLAIGCKFLSWLIMPFCVID